MTLTVCIKPRQTTPQPYIKGEISADRYHTTLERLQLTSGLGFFPEPEIHIISGAFKENNIILMTTDGIHYCIKEDAMLNIILMSQNTHDAVEALIMGARQLKYEDNMSAVTIFNVTDKK